MSMLLIFPAVTAVVTMACAVRPAAGRLMRFGLLLAAINVVLTPFTSGEWFYQHAELSTFQDAVNRGDFTSVEDLMSRHDPFRLRKTIVIAVSLLAALGGLALVQLRASRGSVPKRVTSTAAAVAFVVGAGAIVAMYQLLT